MARRYNNSRRSAAAAATAERIVDVTQALLLKQSISTITLQSIAADSGVTVQTVLRHMGSREGCLLAVGERLRERVERDRFTSQPGDIPGALAGLLIHYERDGGLVLKLLAEEFNDPLAQQAVGEGRSTHRAWVERCFGPLLPETDRELVVDALVVSTDLTVWHLLRQDLSRSPEQVARVIEHLVRAVIERS
jgi:AcrR family transcriptional regulator